MGCYVLHLCFVFHANDPLVGLNGVKVLTNNLITSFIVYNRHVLTLSDIARRQERIDVEYNLQVISIIRPFQSKAFHLKPGV